VRSVLFDHVWKKFYRGERHDSLRDLIPGALRTITSRRAKGELESEEFWALKDVSFEVKPGEALGIIGPNGAGKSTALKLLTRILRPTRGQCQVAGRVGALIEVAAGFHPELTGRENVYLQGAIMGMRRTEVVSKFDEIVAFAGLEDFVDMPVKRYSSGMNARLGFSIAAHLNPDVLIIDEVLAVGDVEFQERCLERMRWFKRGGVAIVLVSHNLQSVVELCDHAMFLNGRVCAIGATSDVIGRYVRDAFAASGEARQGEIHINSAELRHLDGTPVAEPVEPRTTLRVTVEFGVVVEISDVTFAFLLHRSTDQLTVYAREFSAQELQLASPVPGRFSIQFQFQTNLTRGQYHLDVFVKHIPSQRCIARLRPAGHFTIAENRTWAGVADLNVSATVSGLSIDLLSAVRPDTTYLPDPAAPVK